MSAHAMTQTAYGDATRAMASPRNVEYQVFRQVTGQLSRASVSGKPFGELAMALHENLRLWTVVAMDVTDADNGLPVSLRGQLADLSKFTRSHTQKVLRQQADAAILIEINTAVMRGLRGQLPSQET